MGSIGASAGTQLTLCSACSGLAPGEWKPLFDMEGGWMQSVVVQAPSEDVLRAIYRAANGRAVSVDGFHATVQVNSSHVDLSRGGQ